MVAHVESRFSKDQILTLVSIYWHTRTIGTSVRYYHANGLGNSRSFWTLPGPIRVPQGYAEFPGIPARSRPPRSLFDEEPANVAHWSVYDSGGHFPAIEEPEPSGSGSPYVLPAASFDVATCFVVTSRRENHFGASALSIGSRYKLLQLAPVHPIKELRVLF